MNTLYQVSRSRRFLDLMIQPWLAMTGVAMVAYGAIKAWPHLHELGKFLRHGWVAWVAAAPIAFVTVPFLVIYASVCVRAVARCWIDAVSNDIAIADGTVALVSSDRFGFMSGRIFVTGTMNRLSVDGRVFTTVPKQVLNGVTVEDHIRVTYTPRVHYVVAIARLERLDAVASAGEAKDSR